MLECFGVPKFLRCYYAARDGLSGGSHFFAHVFLLIIHSLKSIASGMLSSVETPKVQADVSQNWVQ